MSAAKKKIAVFTGTRAEYGLLHWLLREIEDDPQLELQLIAGAMHYSPEFGETWREIARDGFEIAARIELLLSSNTGVGVAKSMGLGTIGAADALDRLRPDWLIVLGDRFEALAVVQAALVMRIPVAHLHGGELTEGAYDDAIRHAISKMSLLHFTAAEVYRQRVIQLGESPDRVFNVGAIGLDHLRRAPRMSLAALAESLQWPLRQPFLLVTYHPVTAADEPAEASFEALLTALDSWPDHQILITYPNADNGGRGIIERLKAYAARQPQRVCAIPSLGQARYLSALALAEAMVGNSSSGLIEAPALKVPTVNIGQRQQGRLCADSVVQCAATTEAIQQALAKVLTAEFRAHCEHTVNPYGQGDTSRAVLAHIKAAAPATLKKFHDLPVECAP